MSFARKKPTEGNVLPKRTSSLRTSTGPPPVQSRSVSASCNCPWIRKLTCKSGAFRTRTSRAWMSSPKVVPGKGHFRPLGGHWILLLPWRGKSQSRLFEATRPRNLLRDRVGVIQESQVLRPAGLWRQELDRDRCP
jgi:hypothetical protein